MRNPSFYLTKISKQYQVDTNDQNINLPGTGNNQKKEKKSIDSSDYNI